MKNALRALLFVGLIAWLMPAGAQQFSNVPAQTVIGRIGIPGDTGPSQAIPFVNLIGQLNVLSRNGDNGIYVKCFGIDDTIAIQTALTAGGSVHLPIGTCKITSTLTITQNFTKLSCQAPDLTTITANFASTPMVSLSAGIISPIVEGCGFTRSVTATSGGTGIGFIGASSTPIIRNNEISNQYVGAVLRSTGYGQHYGNFYHTNVVDGVEEINTASDGSLQWYSSSNLYQTNGSRGHAIIAVAGPAQVTVGSQINDATFANSGAGLAFFGLVGTPIQGVRVNGGFYGQDGNSEIYLDTYGGQHHIEGAFTELAGTGLTGPTLTTAASGIGNGIEVTANNLDATITSVVGNSNSQNGIKSSATGVTNITGARMAGNTGYGALIADGAKATLTASTFASNTGGTVSVTANTASLISCGNFPSTVNQNCVAGAALTKTDDTNVTLTLGGAPTTALVNAASLTLGWTGTLSLSRGGLGIGSGTSGGVPYFSSGSTVASSGALGANLFVVGGGAGAAPATITTAQAQANLGIGVIEIMTTGVNFNSANTDTAITIALPTGFTRYVIQGIRISHASATLTTATAGVFSSTGGGGTTIASNAAVTISTASENLVNNLQTLALFSSNSTTSYNFGTLQFRVGTAQGSAATADVEIMVFPIP